MTQDQLDEAIRQMSDEAVELGIERAKADLLIVRTKDDAEMIFAAGVLLVLEQRRRRDVLTEELRRVLTAGTF